MADGAEWSAHLDFVARLMDCDKSADPLWPLLKAERDALAELNVPHFVSPTDSDEIADASGVLTRSGARPGLDRAQARFAKFDSEEIAQFMILGFGARVRVLFPNDFRRRVLAEARKLLRAG